MKLHVIPVPRGMTPEEAWAEIQTMGRLVEYSRWNWRYWPGFRKWAVIQEDEPMNPTLREVILNGPECDYPTLHELGDCVWCDAYYS